MAVINEMTKVLLLFSHALTEDQEEDANKCLNISEFIPLSQDLQKLWMNIQATKRHYVII